VLADCRLFHGVWHPGERYTVWMSHGDRVTKLPDGFRTVAVSENAPFAAVADEERGYYGVQFHPEVAHTPHGALLLRNFVRDIAGATGDWSMAAFRQEAIERIRAQVGEGRVICGLSGGVDSAVAAVLIHEAIADQLTCVFVDHGLLRQGEADEVVTLFRNHYNIPLVHVRAQELFLGALAGVSDPETKRKTIGRLFIDVFEEEAKTLGGAEFLAQGTLYPDVIESVSHTGRPVGHDQEPPQRRRPARAHEHAPRRAPARAVQGRGEGRSARSSACRTASCPATRFPARPRHPLPRRRSRRTSSTSCARPTRST
jgi:GMP synthase (glutamine-hydrolysing)